MALKQASKTSKTRSKAIKADEAEIRADLMRLAKVMRNDLERYLNRRKTGITPQQYGLLWYLQPKSLTLSEVCKLMSVEPPTLVAVVDDMEHKGLIERQKDTKDRRRVPLAITKKGREQFDDIGANYSYAEDTFARGLQSIGPAKQKQLAKIFKEIIEYI